MFPFSRFKYVPVQVCGPKLTRQPLTLTEPPLAHEASNKADGRQHHLLSQSRYTAPNSPANRLP